MPSDSFFAQKIKSLRNMAAYRQKIRKQKQNSSINKSKLPHQTCKKFFNFSINFKLFMTGKGTTDATMTRLP